MGMLSWLLQLPFSRRQRIAMKLRGEVSLESFLNDISESPFEREVALSLWHHLRSQSVEPDFKPSPGDSLIHIYGIAEEELDEDLILSLLSKHGIPIPDPESITSFGPVSTPRDVVRFLAHLKRESRP
ncbi:MAG TPA: hypothetical protein VF589_12685 [Allosphingosinicella sp.]|jgi:hypothetical protein